VVEVVVAVRVDVPAVVPLIDTEVGETAHVAGLASFVMLSVTAQVNVTVPVQEFSGVTVMVDVPLAPAVAAMLPLLERVISLLPVGAAQKFLHPERDPITRKLKPRMQTLEKPIRSGAANLRSHASSPKFIAAPFVIDTFSPASRLALSSGYCLYTGSGEQGLPRAQVKRRAAIKFARQSRVSLIKAQETQSSRIRTLRLKQPSG
jgi:hypothetical protein